MHVCEKNLPIKHNIFSVYYGKIFHQLRYQSSNQANILIENAVFSCFKGINTHYFCFVLVLVFLFPVLFALRFLTSNMIPPNGATSSTIL